MPIQKKHNETAEEPFSLNLSRAVVWPAHPLFWHTSGVTYSRRRGGEQGQWLLDVVLLVVGQPLTCLRHTQRTRKGTASQPYIRTHRTLLLRERWVERTAHGPRTGRAAGAMRTCQANTLRCISGPLRARAGTRENWHDVCCRRWPDAAPCPRACCGVTGGPVLRHRSPDPSSVQRAWSLLQEPFTRRTEGRAACCAELILLIVVVVPFVMGYGSVDHAGEARPRPCELRCRPDQAA